MPFQQSQKLQKKASLYTLKQKPHQSVTEFVYFVQAEAKGLTLSEADLVFVIIQGIFGRYRLKTLRPVSILERTTKRFIPRTYEH